MDGLVGCGKCARHYILGMIYDEIDVVVVFLLCHKSVPDTISSERKRARRDILRRGRKATSERMCRVGIHRPTSDITSQ